MKTEDWEAAAEKALREVLDADAVSNKPLEEFVAACIAGRPGRMSALVEWISAPRRAFAATVAGSFVLTSVLLVAIWCVTLVGTPPAGRHEHAVFPMREYQLADMTTHVQEEGDSGNGS